MDGATCNLLRIGVGDSMAEHLKPGAGDCPCEGSNAVPVKGRCAQCLQWQIDPKTGKRTKAVYACSWQEQPMELIDTANIKQRLSQNHVQEVLSSCWLDYLFAKYDIIRV